MTPQELKNSILQLAVQGKLVEQHPEEGSAEELYQQIQAEKQCLIKERKIKKGKSLPEISDDEIPFDIPDTWKWVRLLDLCSLISDGTHKTPTYVENGIPFLSVKDISHGVMDFSNTKFISPQEHQQLSQRCKPEKGDVLICRIGTLGKALRINSDVEFSIFVSLGLIKLMDKDIADYIALTINSGYGFSWIQRVKVGGGTHTFKINLDDLRLMPIPLPPKMEQKRIVAKIEELLPYIDRYEMAWGKLEAFNKRFPDDMQKSLTHAAIQGKLVGHDPSEGTGEDLYRQIQATKNKLIKEGIIKKEKPFADITEEEIPFDIPSSWKWVRLGELIKFQGGYAYKSTSYVPSSNNQVVRLGNVKTNNLLLDVKQVFIPDDIAASTEDYLIQADDILVTMTGTRKKRDYFFTLAISENDLSMRKLYLNQRVGCLRPIKGIDVSFLLFVLQSEVIKDLIFAKETGTANQGNIGSEDMKRCVLIPLPPLAEQKRIVQKLDEILPLCKKLK